jgi:hypothetical protein
MARFLSPSWVAEQNAMLADLAPTDTGADGGPALPDGPVTVVQEVTGGPDGDVRLVMTVDDGAIRLCLDPKDGEDGADGADGADSEHPQAPRAALTIRLSYGDAASLSRGELSPADALNAGRIRVRGDLSVLVEAQNLLAAARSASGAPVPPTTY